MKEKHLKLVEDHYQVSSDFVEFRRQLEDGFASIAAASADVTTQVKQLDLVTDPPVLAPNCQSLPPVAEFISRVAADIRTYKNKTARWLCNDRNGPASSRRSGCWRCSGRPIQMPSRPTSRIPFLLTHPSRR